VAKSKKKKEEIDKDAARILMQAMWDGQMSGMNPAESAAANVGLRLPHLCLRFLFQSTILPFQRTFLILGPTGSNKSSLLYYFYSLFLDNGGRYAHMEVEDKDTPLLRLSLTKFNRQCGRVIPCESMNHFQREVKKSVELVMEMCNKSKLGKTVPFVVGIDSLTAKMTEEAYATVDKNSGETKRRFAGEALSLSDWFKVEPKYLVGWPFNLIGIRHEKPGTDKYGNPIHQGPGGAAPKFMATYEFLTSRIKKLKQTAQGWEGNRIGISTTKSSLGSDQRRIEAEIAWRPSVWTNSKGEVVPSQETVWSWGKATIDLLDRLQNDTGPFATAVDELIGLTKPSAGRYGSHTMGIRGDQCLSASEMAAVIEGNADLLKELEPRLGIGRGVVFDPSGCFDTQIREAIESVNDLVPQPYAGDTPPEMQPQEDTNEESE